MVYWSASVGLLGIPFGEDRWACTLYRPTDAEQDTIPHLPAYEQAHDKEDEASIGRH